MLLLELQISAMWPVELRFISSRAGTQGTWAELHRRWWWWWWRWSGLGGGVEEVCRIGWGLRGLPFFLLVSANYKMQFCQLITIIIISNLVFYAQSTITVIAGRNDNSNHNDDDNNNKQSFL